MAIPHAYARRELRDVGVRIVDVVLLRSCELGG
jgi:hypothetical protein